jgi:hypothetical protein
VSRPELVKSSLYFGPDPAKQAIPRDGDHKTTADPRLNIVMTETTVHDTRRQIRLPAICRWTRDNPGACSRGGAGQIRVDRDGRSTQRTVHAELSR